MIKIDYDFFDYLIHDELGDFIGIRDDAPEEAKKAYAEFKKAYDVVRT